MAIKVGNKAPAFRLESSTGDTVSLKEYAGKWVIVYFYPRDNTPGCTTEANEFQASLTKIKRNQAVVLGVSKDSIASHCKFADKYGLKFPLLSDPEGKMLEKYDAWGEKKLYGKTSMGIIRSTVLVNPEGRVAHHWPKVRVKGHVEAVIEKLKELRKAAK